MIGKLLLLLRTVRYLRIKQVVYQIYYRLKPLKALSYYENDNIHFSSLKFSFNNVSSDAYKGNNSFVFLNQPKQFPATINWNFQDHGKLWNYNLQYFNFLNQEGLSNDLKETWLSEIGNSLKKGTLPLEPYPVALRVMNTIRYLSSNENNNIQIIKDVYAQLNFLYHHLEYHLLGNHLLEDAFALFMGGKAFNEEAWIEKSKTILYKELDEQILSDGAHFELSMMYHQIILFRVLELIDWHSRSTVPDIKFLNYVKEKANKMLSWLKSISFNNGDIPHFNDSAPGIAFTSPELFAFAQQLGLPEPSVVPLTDSGYRKFENGKYECVIDVGAIAASYQPGHTHADIFSFVLCQHHSPLIVDVGTSTYEKGEQRNYERSTKAHNTVVIENENQFEVWGGFRVGRRASVKIINETDSSIIASHDGYSKLFNAVHERSFYFEQGSIRIVDTIHNSNKVNAKSYIHFHPDCKVEEKDGRIMINNIAEISFINAKKTDLELYKYASGYNSYRDAKALVVEFRESLESMIKFV